MVNVGVGSGGWASGRHGDSVWFGGGLFWESKEFGSSLIFLENF